MSHTNPLHLLVGVLLTLTAPGHGTTPRRDERGLSQSTENAILLAGAVATYSQDWTSRHSRHATSGLGRLYGRVTGWQPTLLEKEKAIPLDLNAQGV